MNAITTATVNRARVACFTISDFGGAYFAYPALAERSENFSAVKRHYSLPQFAGGFWVLGTAWINCLGLMTALLELTWYRKSLPKLIQALSLRLRVKPNGLPSARFRATCYRMQKHHTTTTYIFMALNALKVCDHNHRNLQFFWKTEQKSCNLALWGEVISPKRLSSAYARIRHCFGNVNKNFSSLSERLDSQGSRLD